MTTLVRCDFECVISNCIIIISESEVLRGKIKLEGSLMYARFVRLGHIIIYNFLIEYVSCIYIYIYIFICTRFTYIVWVTVIHYYVKIFKYMSVLMPYYNAKNHSTALFVYFNKLQFILKKENNMQIYYIKKYIMLYVANLA